MKIEIKGVIVSNNDMWIYEWFEMDAVSPNVVNEQLEKANGEDIEVVINSGGGDVFAGSEIYTAIKEYKGNVTTKIVGIAASAASVIAMAGDRVLMSPTAQMMIHNVSSMAWGDYRDLEHEAEVLKNYNKTISNAYRIKSDLEESELLEMMSKETWLTSQQALNLNLIDEVMFENQTPKLVASGPGTIPQVVIDKIRNVLKNEKPKDNKTELKRKEAKVKFDLLNLRGKTE